MRNKVLEKLIEKRFQGPDVIRHVLKSTNESSKRRRPSTVDGSSYLKGIYRGNYYRIKIPEKTKTMRIPSLPPVAPPPDLNAMVAEASFRAKTSFTRVGAHQKQKYDSMGQSPGRRFVDWIRANWAVVLLNFGSICTLTAFTRSDVLELRSLSATGSICNATYHASSSPFNWFSVLWPTIFASVNLWKIGEILEERNADVHLSEEEERIFVEHFMPHGITPKQFERLETKAEIISIRKDGFIIRQGSPLEHVYLVVQGSTTASILGRHLSAQSTSSRTRGDQKLGGDSGVWIGEMTFLDKLWEKEQKKIDAKGAKAEEKIGETGVSILDDGLTDKGSSHSSKDTTKAMTPHPAATTPPSINKTSKALYTIVAKKDCIVWRWSFEDMDALMSSSAVSGFFLSIQFPRLAETLAQSISRADYHTSYRICVVP
jgi:CRP-like cAMP-binding protein